MNQVAPEGQVYVCGACGKRSRDKYGDQKISYGWDVSCMLHAVLCYDEPGAGTTEKPWRTVEEEKA
jgi:hypothetical protein